ncbi:MAG: hypothetical protein P1U57_05765 [Oleibacter sp.]|nr:hypothetical protein [Thalassolituus sp.]
MAGLTAAIASLMMLPGQHMGNEIIESAGYEVKSVVIDHNGIDVPFSYQLWKVIPKSVCSSYSQNISGFSKCTLAAKDLFTETCLHYDFGSLNNRNSYKLKNMFCNASVSYQPVLANVQWSSEPSEIDQARSDCNVAKAALLGRPHDPQAVKVEKEACSLYQSLKSKK